MATLRLGAIINAYIVAYLLALVMLPATAVAGDGTQGTANEPTPIRYLVCDAFGNECFVVARFKNLETCEGFKAKDRAYCDSVSVPGKMICDTTRESKISTSFCTK